MSVKNLFIAVHIMFGVFALYTSNNYALALWVFATIWVFLERAVSIRLRRLVVAQEGVIEKLMVGKDGIIRSISDAIEASARGGTKIKGIVIKNGSHADVELEGPEDD